MDGYQTLEDDSPCRVPEPVLQRSKDLAHSGLPGMRSHEYVFDVFCLGRCGLAAKERADACQQSWRCSKLAMPQTCAMTFWARGTVTNLDLGGALDGLFKGARHDGGCPLCAATAANGDERVNRLVCDGATLRTGRRRSAAMRSR